MDELNSKFQQNSLDNSSTNSDGTHSNKSTDELLKSGPSTSRKHTPPTGHNSDNPDDTSEKKNILSRLFKKEKIEPNVNDLSARDDALAKVTIDTLPQVYVAKYLGFRSCKGLWGVRHTRKPVEELVESVGKIKRGDELALVHIEISKTGINLKTHPSNKNTKFEPGFIPIEYISYGVQDVKFSRVFAFIVVREMSKDSKKTECHGYVCDSTLTARKLALSVSLAFQQYAKILKGKPHGFHVDLRKAAEKEKDDAKQDEECDA
ncbi:unnamed protein product [Owenia fusiformis]|uniref:Uncharacterized protein n=1 Tax=Owenia fusiformis TaxID=6347 RepID=A0A8J1U941_OWEFU|nr:unnamed protein product [Owenia fusiformis]